MQNISFFIGSIGVANMLNIQLDMSAKRTYTKQIYHKIRQMILSGELTAGEALPPYRELSSALGVSKNTVLAAYDMLVADGVLRSAVGSGFYVETGIKRRVPIAPVRNLQSAALTDVTIPDGTVNFDNGQPALELFPRAKWSRAVSEAMMNISSAALGYDLPQGRPELRRELCVYLKKALGISCSPEQIIITSGAKQAISLAAECLLKGSREACIEDPSPALLSQLLSCHTANIAAVRTDQYGLDPTALSMSNGPALVVCSPARQFPTGSIMPMTRRIALVDFAEKANSYILEDHFESEFNYDAPPASSLFEISPEHVISVGTFSKVMYPSVRLGYMVVPPKLIRELCTLKRLSDHHTNSVYQLALASFIADGTLEKHIRRMKRKYRSRRDFLINRLTDLFGDSVKISGASSGMSIVAAFDGIRFTDELTRKMLQNGVYAVSVESQSIHKGVHESELILRYTGLTEDELRLGAERLHAVLSESPK